MDYKICLFFLLIVGNGYAQIRSGPTPATENTSSTSATATPDSPPQDPAHLAATFKCEAGDKNDPICNGLDRDIVVNYFRDPGKHIGTIVAQAKALVGTEKSIGIFVHVIQWKGDKVSGEAWLACGTGRARFPWIRTFSCDTNKYLAGVRHIRVLFLHGGVTDATALFARNAHYYVIDKAKEALWLQHLKALLGLAGAQSQEVPTEPKTFVGYGTLREVADPSDITVAGVAENPALNSPQRIGEPTIFDNEGRSAVDFTVAVPVNKISVVQYEQNESIFLPKEVNKQSVYGAANIYPWPVFLGHGRSRFLVPRAIVGIGLTGRPGSAFLLGGSWGVSWFQVFVGSAFVAHDVKSENPSDALSRQRYSSQLTYGLNIPVLQAVKKLAKPKNGGSQ